MRKIDQPLAFYRNTGKKRQKYSKKPLKPKKGVIIPLIITRVVTFLLQFEISNSTDFNITPKNSHF